MQQLFSRVPGQMSQLSDMYWISVEINPSTETPISLYAESFNREVALARYVDCHVHDAVHTGRIVPAKLKLGCGIVAHM